MQLFSRGGRSIGFVLMLIACGAIIRPGEAVAADGQAEATAKTATARPIAVAGETNYSIVVSQQTAADPQWQAVVAALVKKHRAEVLTFDQSIEEVLPALAKTLPRYTCFVARGEEATRQFVAQLHRLTRKLDSDPYTDTIWGILTGFEAADALRAAERTEPLEIHRTAAGTEVLLAACDEGVWFCELKQGRKVRKETGKPAAEEQGPSDTTRALVDTLGDYKPQLFVTSGHATERDWQIGFAYRNGQFRSQAGKLIGRDTKGNEFPIRSDNPKVYLAVGNCLMGHIDGPDAMALAFMHSAGVEQMVGYTELTWYGYGGWGMLDYFVEQPGRFTLAEAFFANQQALLQRLETYFPSAASADAAQLKNFTLTPQAKQAGLTLHDLQGLMHDRDSVAFYGDPGWPARMAPSEVAWQQSITENQGEFELQIAPRLGEASFAPRNTNGSQRGGRPIVQLLPRRIDLKSVRVVAGSDLKPLITENFVLVPLPKTCDPQRVYTVKFSVQPEKQTAKQISPPPGAH